MDLEWNDAAILGAAPIIRKLVDAVVEAFPTLSRYKLFVSVFFAAIAVAVKAVPEPYQSYTKLTAALVFATAFYNDWYKSRKSAISVENIEKVNVSQEPVENLS